ncbi:MAG: translation initiation factor IF-2 [Desulfohalobiaceae bacterium]|nr:translation initiation factor IF-2 [Desulfohalobiaceae bacterium]
MTTMMRVRELSQKLNISNKELLHLLREENIQVKSHMSGLTEEDVQLVRQKIMDQHKEEKSEQKVTSSGVIVRRRRHQKREKVETRKAAAEEAGLEQQAAPEPEPRTVSEPREPEREEPGLQEEVKEEVEAKAPTEPVPSAKPAEPAESAEPGTGEAAPKKAPAKRRSRKKKKAPEPPSVTVISRPEPSAEPEPPAARAKPATPAEESKKRKKKDKRVVDVSGLYQQQTEQPKPQEAPKRRKRPEGKGKQLGKLVKGRRPSRGKEQRAAPKSFTQPLKAAKRKIRMEEAIRVSDLAQEIGVKAQEIIKILFNYGVMTTINKSLDLETATLVAAEFGYDVEDVGFSEASFLMPKKEDKTEELQIRPPVVTIMGHVDHGKTSLLDAVRESKVMAGEAGGITQHIGAYHVDTDKGSLVFLDTPGHEAFTEMRSRGAQVTDIVILIVAADDGVMDQTREAINHAKAAEVPIIVAINKIDKDNADLDRVKRELADEGLISEEWGGDTMFANISAKQRTGIDQLMEMVLLQAEVLELKANPEKRARGHIVEAKLDKGRGPVGTVLVQEGTLHAGDYFVCGLFGGKIRALSNDVGQPISSAGPSMPVEIQGFDGIPNAGDEFVVVEDDKAVKKIIDTRRIKHRERELAKEGKVTLEGFFAAKAEEELKTLNLIVKADVQGSLEAIQDSIAKLSTDKVKVNSIHGGIGAITETDVKLAAASSAVIIGFNVRPSAKVKEEAEKEQVDIRFYDVIYHLVNEVKEAMAGMLAPVTREIYLGQAEVREVFTIPRVGAIAGCYVLDGKLQRNAGVRLLRDGVVIYTGRLSSLKRFKDDAKEVGKDYECGAGLERFNDIKIGDIIEAYDEVQEKATL